MAAGATSDPWTCPYHFDHCDPAGHLDLSDQGDQGVPGGCPSMEVRFPNPFAGVSSLKGTVARHCIVERADCGSQDGCLLRLHFNPLSHNSHIENQKIQKNCVLLLYVNPACKNARSRSVYLEIAGKWLMNSFGDST